MQIDTSQLFTQSYKYPNICKLQTGRERCAGNYVTVDTADRNTIYDNVLKDPELKKTAAIMDKAGVRSYFRQIGDLQGTELNGLTLFVCVDAKIPDAFADNISLFRAKAYLNSYTLNGVATVKYMVENGSSLYTTKNADNPILCVVRQSPYTVGTDERRDTEITINSVGRIIKEVICSNGTLIVLDNIGSGAYVNGGTY